MFLYYRTTLERVTIYLVEAVHEWYFQVRIDWRGSASKRQGLSLAGTLWTGHT